MKELKKLGEGSNYTAVSAGKFDNLNEFVLPMGNGVEIKGKVFTGAALKATGMEMSLQTMAPGEASPFLYMIVKGEGEFTVDGETIQVSEGSLVRVAPAGKRAMRNTGKDNMVVMCIQYMADSFGASDTPAEDGILM